MSIEDLKKSMKMWTWDGEGDCEQHKVKRDIVHIYSDGSCIDINGYQWDHHEEIKEPTYRPIEERRELKSE